MPRYFFHTSGADRVLDDHGADAADNAAAIVDAVRFAGELLQHNPEQLLAGEQWRTDLTDADHNLVFSLVTIAIVPPVFQKPASDLDPL